MADKAKAKTSTVPQPIPQTHITIGGNVTNSNIIAGHNNVVNVLPADQSASLHQLPSAPGDFVGRSEALAQIVKQEREAISGLSGLGGVGKTALGLVAAHKLAEKYPDAQFFLDLRGASQNPLTPQEAMRHIVLSFDPMTDLRPYNDDQLRGLYLSRLTGKHTLLFFDNARDAAQVRPLLPPSGNKVLITSRTHFTLEGMGEPLRLDVLPNAEAQQLLTEICPRLGEVAPRLAQLCGYLPLALRIAATFLVEHPDWTPAEYSERLEKQRLKTLKVESDPQQDVEAVFELSYDLLNEDERARWRALSVFTAPFSRLALTAVCNLDDDPAHDFAGKVQRMSLLEYDAQTNRYHLHDLLRDFATARLNVQDDFGARKKHAEFFVQVAEVADNLYEQGGDNVLYGLKLFDSEWVHIQAAQDWSAQNLEGGAAELALRLPYAGLCCLDLRLMPRQRIAWYETGLRAARFLKNKSIETVLITNLGNAYADLGEMRRAIEFHEQGLVIDRETGNQYSEGADLTNLGRAYAVLGETRRAIKFYKQALAIYSKHGYWRGAGITFGNLGIAYSNLGDMPRAIKFYEQALTIARKTGDKHGEGAILGNFGSVYLDLGQTRRAIEFYEQQLMIDREIGDHRGEGNALIGIGSAYLDLSQTRRAIKFYKQALTIARETGDRLAIGSILGNLGYAYADLSETRRAIEFYEQQLTIDREIGDQRGEGIALNNLGIAYCNLGELTRAQQLGEQALKILLAIENPNAEGTKKWLEELGQPPIDNLDEKGAWFQIKRYFLRRK